MKETPKRFSSEAIISISAIIIAIASIFISVWQGLETRKHNRLSVRPNLEIHFTASNEGFGYSLINTGLGPAMITKRNIIIEGIKGQDLRINEIPELLDINDLTFSYGPTDQGASILAGEKRDLILFKLNSEETRFRNLLNEVPEKLIFRIEYRSMYGEKLSCSSSKE